jgi:hypothetical protein
MSIKEQIIQFIISNDLYMFPLHSIGANGSCTCNSHDCTSPGKHPLLSFNWKLSATNKEDNIRGWFNRPMINYAIATGRKSNTSNKKLIVIDIDDSNHPFIERMPKTFSYRTGSGGYHFWFWTQYNVSNSVGYLSTKVDVRGTNGYVIIPPSIHKTGESYNFFENSLDNPILNIPDWIETKLLSRNEERTTTKTKRREKKIKKIVLDEQYNDWNCVSIKQLRKYISDGKKIPLGMRNVVLHRLLSSDRAHGMEVNELLIQGRNYRISCEDAESINETEIKNIIGSVSKYEPINNSYEHVNQKYFNFLKKRGKKFSIEDVNKLEKTDSNFFSLLQITDNSNEFVSLQDIARYREEWMKESGYKSYSKYPFHLLAAKLKSLGFERFRTAKKNLWKITLKKFKKEEYIDILDIQEPKEQVIHMTMKITEEQTVKIRRKNHPNEGKYGGKASMETASALTKLLSILEPSQLEELEERKLILNEESTAELFDSIRSEDVIGVAYFKDNEGLVSTKMKVSKIENDIIYGTDIVYSKKHFPIEVTFEDVSLANAIGFAEILYRDNVPFGVDLDVELKVRLWEEQKDIDTNVSGSVNTENTSENTDVEKVNSTESE